MKELKIFLSAGEASGDLHASELMKALRAEGGAGVRFTFLGGDLMAAVAGHAPLVDYRDMAYMGFSEVLRNLGKVRRNLAAARAAIRRERPDAVVLVDYPSFNLRLAREAHVLGIPVYYFIAPKVWAWKKWRVRQLRKYCTRVLSILPFEVNFFKEHGVPVEYVGNPSLSEIDARRRELPAAGELLCRAGLPEGAKYIALVPGSRRGEIRNNLPLMAEAAGQFAEYKAIVAGAPGIEAAFYRQYTSLPVLADSTFALMAHAEAALVTSGTATLECALLETPQVICYRGNGSPLTYNIMKHILTIPFVSLPNLITGRETARELLLHLCTAEAIAAELSRILPGGEGRAQQLAGYAELRRRLADPADAPRRAAHIILNSLPERSTQGF